MPLSLSPHVFACEPVAGRAPSLACCGGEAKCPAWPRDLPMWRRRRSARDSVPALFTLLWSACRRKLAVGNTPARRTRPRISHSSWRLWTTLAGRVTVSSFTFTYAFVSVACADKLKKFLQEYEVEGSRKFEPVLVCCSSCFALAFRLLARMSGYALPLRWLVVPFESVSMSDDLLS
jgi:hypothetical protein